jgi:O-antigen/teichoic acid export membrane protein
MNTRKTFFRGNILNILSQFFKILRTIVIIPIIIKSVGIVLYGKYALFQTIVGFLFGLSAFGVGVSMNRYMPAAEDKAEKNGLFMPQFYFQAFSLTMMSSIFIAFPNAAVKTIFGGEMTFSVWIIPLFLFSMFLNAQGYNYYRNILRIGHMVVMPMAVSVVFITLIIAYNQIALFNLNSLIIITSVSYLIVSLPALNSIRKDIGIFNKSGVYKYRNELMLGFPVVLNFVVDFILSGSDRFFISKYLSLESVGIYSVAYTIGSLIIMIPRAISGILPQMMIKAHKNGSSEFFTLQRISIKLYLLLAIPYTFFMILFGKYAVYLLANYEIAEKSGYIVSIISLSQIFYGLNIIISNNLFIKLDTKRIFYANAIAAIANLVLNMILLYYFKSIFIPAITTVLGYLTANIYLSRSIGKKTILNVFDVKFIWKLIIISSFIFPFKVMVGYFQLDMYNILHVTGAALILFMVFIVLARIINIFPEYAIVREYFSANRDRK